MTEDATSSPTGAGWWTRRWVRPVAVGVWAGALVAFCVQRGIPIDRSLQALWILAGIAAAMVGRPWRAMVRILTDWLPFLGALLVYDFSRGIADTLGMPVQVAGPLNAERLLFGGLVPTVELQGLLYDPSAVRWWDVVASLVYFSHFIVPWALAGVLYVRGRDRWAAYARRILALSFAGLVTYVLLPAAPPWYAAREELIPAVERISGRGWSSLGLHGAGVLLERAQAGVNVVAAIPSLHGGMALLVALWFWPSVRSWWGRTLLLAYPVAMGVTLVYSGEHYAVDVVIGWAYVGLVLLTVSMWEKRHTGRQSRRGRRRARTVEEVGVAAHSGSGEKPEPRAGHAPDREPAPVTEKVPTAGNRTAP